jgi:hypothetical protein
MRYLGTTTPYPSATVSANVLKVDAANIDAAAPAGEVDVGATTAPTGVVDFSNLCPEFQ